MIISRTPYRISFFGGGTDYPAWYLKNGGQVLSTTIDKYLYITCRYLPPFFEHKLRVAYSKIEEVKHPDDISHLAVRETLKFFSISNGLEIHYDGDLPGRSGMGSSSSFTVGLIHALYAFQGKLIDNHQLAMDAIYIEQNMIKEIVGSQDQVNAAYGGLNKIQFRPGGEIIVNPVTISQDRAQALERNLMLFYTGIVRTAEKVARSYVMNIETKEKPLMKMFAMVDEAIEILKKGDLDDFGLLLDKAWQEKRSLSKQVSNSNIDEIYTKALSAGALGGKLSGAGGGGFLLLYVPHDEQAAIKKKLSHLLHVPFNFETNGSQIIFYDQHKKYEEEEQSQAGNVHTPFVELKDMK